MGYPLIVIALNFVISYRQLLIQVDSKCLVHESIGGSTFIEQFLAAELLESARIRRLKSRGMWARTCSIKANVL